MKKAPLLPPLPWDRPHRPREISPPPLKPECIAPKRHPRTLTNRAPPPSHPRPANPSHPLPPSLPGVLPDVIGSRGNRKEVCRKRVDTHHSPLPLRQSLPSPPHIFLPGRGGCGEGEGRLEEREGRGGKGRGGSDDVALSSPSIFHGLIFPTSEGFLGVPCKTYLCQGDLLRGPSGQV